MTHDERTRAVGTARRELGDALLDPDATEKTVAQARERLNNAERMLRGVPHTLAGVSKPTGAGYQP